MHRWLSPGAVLALLIATPAPLRAASIVDATGRTVVVPETVARVLPAGGPAGVLLEALAPDLMLGWAEKPSAAKAALLSPQAASLPAVPHPGHGGTPAAIAALKPDLIVDYGTVSPGYIAQAEQLQDQTGIASVLLDGRLSQTPQVLRALGAVLHRQDRAETLARLAEALLAPPRPDAAHPRVAYLRGDDPPKLAAPATGATDVFTRLGWQVVAPAGTGWFRTVTLDDLAALDPDIVIFNDPAMRATVAASPQWRGLRAVREGHAYAAPRLPFGWIEEPPSFNQVLGYAWLASLGEGRDAAPTLAAVFNAVVYGHVMTPDELRAVADAVRPFAP